MCNTINIITDIVIPIVTCAVTVGTVYIVNNFQYKAQKATALINPRIDLLKKFDQILSFDEDLE